MSSKFQVAMQKREAAWKKARKAEARKGGDFGPPAVPDGQYEAVLTAECGITEKGNNPGTPFVRIKATISDGEYTGKEPGNYYYLDGKMPSDAEDALPTNEERLAGDLKTILPDVDVDNMSAAQIESCVEQINALQPKFRIGIKNRIGKKGSKSEGKKFQDVYFNEFLGESSNGEEESEEGGEEITEEEEGEVVEEDGEEGEGDEIVAPVVGDEVNYKPKGAKAARPMQVKTVNQGKQTVTLFDAKTNKRFSEVSWDALQ